MSETDRVKEGDVPRGTIVTDKARAPAEAGAEAAVRGAGEGENHARTDEASESSGQETLDLASKDVAQLLGGAAASSQAAEAAAECRPREVSQAGAIVAEIGRIFGEQPLATLLVAGAAGYMLAYLVHSRR